jgi:two-component system sensor histidine kinase YesM
MNIIVDKTGSVVSFEDAGKIGTKVVDPKSPGRLKDSAYIRLVKDSGFLSGKYLTVYSIYDEDQDWYIVNVSDQSNVIAQLKSQQKMTSLVLIVSLVMLIIIIIFVTNRLSGSIGKIVKAMKVAESGELSVRVQADENMPVEIETIANQFNSLLGKLHASIEKEKEAGIKQKSAEISALEAQINPHFLYNTLDTINWMAIDHDEYEISNAINSLAKILRYGVDKSNSMVEIKQEVEWLKQYVFLQQTRLKNTFECILNIEPNVLGFHIHKLLLQPFVENAIIHGFEGVKRKHELEISIWEGENTLSIRIADNGKGIPDQQLKKIRDGLMNNEEVKSHIGISNAIGRLHMYYADKAKVQIDSELEAGTTILIEIPKL